MKYIKTTYTKQKLEKKIEEVIDVAFSVDILIYICNKRMHVSYFRWEISYTTYYRYWLTFPRSRNQLSTPLTPDIGTVILTNLSICKGDCSSIHYSKDKKDTVCQTAPAGEMFEMSLTLIIDHRPWNSLETDFIRRCMRTNRCSRDRLQNKDVFGKDTHLRKLKISKCHLNYKYTNCLKFIH